MAKRLMPEHIPGTSREWRIKKRRQFKKILDAYDKFRLGCAYTPVDHNGIEKMLSAQWNALKGNWKP